MQIFAVILASVFATSILSGVLGMAGGMILMAILVSTLSVAAAMMLHGAVQATSNGSRAWFLREHIQWRILPLYAAGAAAAVAGFSLLSLVPDPAVVLILVGAFPWLARLNQRLAGLDVTRGPTTFICGVTVTSAQLLAGASGPILDVFYLNTPLTRHQIIASKALTQAIGHILKLVYYGLIIGVTEDIPAWFYLVAMLTAIGGTRVGTRLLDRLDDARFRRISSWIILLIATVCLLKGLRDLLFGA
ncbi:MAG: sulfite exporter TauE/SafE family protein [Proteobacteria bacterium]|nr:sulfite exporter TauE/SafE family protein [Pseudomonadota bacterium]